jgi:hypothetical protein
MTSWQRQEQLLGVLHGEEQEAHVEQATHVKQEAPREDDSGEDDGEDDI